MTKNQKLKLWNEGYLKNGKKLDSLMMFLKLNKNIVYKFNIIATEKLVINHKTGKEKIFFLFLDCLNAAGGNNLTNTSASTKRMLLYLDNLPNRTLVKFSELANSFSKELNIEIKNTKGLFEALKMKGNFPNFRYKKAALFMKQIYLLQKSKKCKIFKDLLPSKVYLPIPLDIVISEVMSRMLGLLYRNRIKISDAEIFENWAREKFKKDYYLIEDLWFWGYFTHWADNKSRYRKVEINYSKINTNPWVYPLKIIESIGLLTSFRDIIK